MENEHRFEIVSKFKPTGDQPEAIDKLSKGIEEGKLEDARRMLDKGFSLDVVVDVTGLSSNQIRNGE